MCTIVVLIAISSHVLCNVIYSSKNVTTPVELPQPLTKIESEIYYISAMDKFYEDQEGRRINKNITAIESVATSHKNQTKKPSTLHEAVQIASLEGLKAMIDLYEHKEPDLFKRGVIKDSM